MVKSEYLLKKASYNLSCFLEIFSCILGIVFFGLIAYSSFEPTINSYIRNEFEGHASFRFPTFPVRLSIFAGSIFAAFTYFLRMLIFFSNIQTNNQKREVQE
jgi:TRAP-type C4-dicarboxylate transport system permease small subunit